MKLRDKPLERLVDAEPAWVNAPERRGVLLHFACPIHEDCYLGVNVSPALDGEPVENGWARTGGEDFETVTLSPSIRILSDCRWHGFIRNGRFETCGDSR